MNASTRFPHPDLRPAAHAVARLAEGVGDKSLSDPTPCPDYAVRELLGHLVGLATAFRDAGRKEFGPTTGTDPSSAPPELPDDWRTLLPLRLDELVQAWTPAAAWEGETQAGGIALPAQIAGRVAVNELVVHGWDLARATGQPYAPEEESLRLSYELLEPSDDDPGRNAIFGPVVAVPEDASLLNRVVGRSGRRPDWQPGD